MKHVIAVLVLITAFYLGAQSQQKGPTFVTGLEVDGKIYTGIIHLRGSNTPDGILSVMPIDQGNGTTTIQFDYYQYPKKDK